MTTETPRLSPSIAKILLDKSPKHAYQAHRLLGGQSKKPSAAQVKGSAVDALVFGGVVPKASAAVITEAEAIAAAVKDELDRRGIVGKAQHRLAWSSYVTGVATECSGVIDLWAPERQMVYELKTSHDLSDYNITKQIEMYRYDLQAAAYLEGIGQQGVGVQFIFAETAAPYDVRFVYMTERMLQHGQDQWNQAVAKWHQCLTSGNWPGRGDFTADVSGWRQKQEADKWLADSGIE